MESARLKIGAFIVVILALGICLGVSFFKLNRAVQPEEQNPLTPVRKLQRLEKSPLGTRNTRNFVHRALDREAETKAAEDAAYGPQ